MPFQTTKEEYMFPDGVAFEVSTDDVTYYNMGTFSAGTTVTYNYDKIETETGNKGRICSRAKNETLALAPSTLMSWDLSDWDKIGANLFTYTAVAGTPVSGATQVFASGSWSFNGPLEIENQNYDISALTINSVTAGTDGALVADTDYFVGVDQTGKTTITVIDSATVTTESQTITVDYDYTPAAGKQITAGASSTVLSRYYVRLRHYTNDALSTYDVELKAYGVDLDSGMSLNFKGANEDGVNEITVAFTANMDTSRTTGEQLFQLYVATDALTSC